VACPVGYEPDEDVLAFAHGEATKGSHFELTDDVAAACKDADVLVTDTWISMGQEDEKAARRKIFAGYQLNDETVGLAAPAAIVLHCLPAYKGEEITEEIFERFADVIFDEAENRLHAQKAILVELMTE